MSASLPLASETPVSVAERASASPIAAAVLWPGVLGARVSPYLHGQFAEHLGRCVYGGLWVGEDSSIPNEGGLRLDALEVLRALEVPVLRWPGGCFADNYHWRDGIGPRAARPKRHNIWWKQPESNAFGTEEFLRLCRLVGAEPYLALNVGSGSVREAADWVEYCNSSQDTALAAERAANGSPRPHGVRFWGVGNENWICGGNMTPEHYADQYRQFATYIRQMEGDRAQLIACGSNGWDIYNPEWDERFLDRMKGALHLLDHLAVHIYFAYKMPAEDFSDAQYCNLLDQVEAADRYIAGVMGLAESYGRHGRDVGVILDEWGTWYTNAVVDNGLSQESTQADAVFTALALHRFQQRGERFLMANMAQTANVLQALYKTRGPRLALTPTYHAMDLLKGHRDARLVHVDEAALPLATFPDGKRRRAVSLCATRAEGSSRLHVTAVNAHPGEAQEVAIRLGLGAARVASARVLAPAALRAKNTFDEPDAVAPRPMDLARGLEAIVLPPHSVAAIELEIQD